MEINWIPEGDEITFNMNLQILQVVRKYTAQEFKISDSLQHDYR